MDDWILVAVVLLLVPSILVTWIAAGAAIAAGRVRRWQVAVAAPVAAVPLLAIGPTTVGRSAIVGISTYPLPALRPSWALLGAFLAILARLLVVTLPVGVPVGLAAAAIKQPRRDLEPEWTETARRRAIRGELRDRRRADRRAASPDAQRSDALAVSISGDLPDYWRRGKAIILPERAAKLPRLIVGRPNAGKSVEIARETYLAGRLADQRIVIDCKGEPGFAAQLIEAYQEGWTDGGHRGDLGAPTTHLWPDEPLNGWVCGPDGPSAIANRLLGCWEFDLASLWYREVVALALRLGLHAPGPPVASSMDLIYRMDAGVLSRFWEQHPDQAALVRRLEGKNKMDDVSIRVANLMGALGGLLDGERAIGDADLTILSLPTMAAEHDCAAILRVVMGDLAHYVSRRKLPGQRLRVVVDEFSAVPGGRLQAIHLAERGRSAGASMALSVQSDRGLGDDEEADRLIGAAGPVLLFATAEPERILKLAGTIQRPEVAWQLEDGQPTGRGTATQRATYRIDANQVRALDPGQAFILSGGRAELVKIIEPPTSSTAVRRPRRALLPRRPKELPRP